MNPPDKPLVNVLLFARAKEIAQTHCIELEVLLPTTIEQIRRQLAQTVPRLGTLLPSCRFAVNDAFVDEDQTVDKNDEIALIPPVSGG